MGHTELSGSHASLWLGFSAGICAVPSASPLPCPLYLIILPGSQELEGWKEQAWSRRGSGARDRLPVQEAGYQCVSSSQGPDSTWPQVSSGRVWDALMASIHAGPAMLGSQHH